MNRHLSLRRVRNRANPISTTLRMRDWHDFIVEQTYVAAALLDMRETLYSAIAQAQRLQSTVH